MMYVIKDSIKDRYGDFGYFVEIKKMPGGPAAIWTKELRDAKKFKSMNRALVFINGLRNRFKFRSWFVVKIEQLELMGMNDVKA